MLFEETCFTTRHAGLLAIILPKSMAALAHSFLRGAPLLIVTTLTPGASGSSYLYRMMARLRWAKFHSLFAEGAVADYKINRYWPEGTHTDAKISFSKLYRRSAHTYHFIWAHRFYVAISMPVHALRLLEHFHALAFTNESSGERHIKSLLMRYH